MTIQDLADFLVKYWPLIVSGGALVAYYRGMRVGPLWRVIGPRSIWPRGRALAVLKASNASTIDLYNERINKVSPPNRYHPWDNVFDRSDWTALRTFTAADFKEPLGTFDREADVELTPRIREKVAGAKRPRRAHVWITGEAVSGRSDLLLHIFFELLGAGQRGTKQPSIWARLSRLIHNIGSRKPVPMLLRPGHLAVGQIEDLRMAGSLEPILTAWLANRGIKVGNLPLPSLAQELETSFRQGKVIVLLDMYDTFIDLKLNLPIDYLLEFPFAVISAATARPERPEQNRSIASLPTVSERYRAGFGRFFAEHQNWLLGGNFADLEDAYTERIIAAIDEASKTAQKVYLVDIMAGGANARWKKLLSDPRWEELHVLALDRDARGIRELLSDNQALSDRYKPWKVELHGSTWDSRLAQDEGNIQREGGLQLEAKVRSEFGDDAAEVDAIVGKKALHEIKRELQPALIQACSTALREGGRLILFTDSMGNMGPDDQNRLEYVRAQLERSALAPAPPDELRSLVLGLEFSRSESSVGLFCNLWVMLKDRANGNFHEVPNRYFASPNEIDQWCTEAGLATNPVTGGTGFYRIAPRKFNEEELRNAFDVLDELGQAVQPDDIDALFANITSRQGPWLSLLVDFTNQHLYADGLQTPLGRRLDATLDPPEWIPEPCHCTSDSDAVTQLLRRVNNASGIAFDFPVHVLEFIKPGLSLG